MVVDDVNANGGLLGRELDLRDGNFKVVEDLGAIDPKEAVLAHG